MPIKKGTKLPKPSGLIRVVCIAHKINFELNAINNPRNHIKIESCSDRLNCNYCEQPARFISVPGNLKIIDTSDA